MYMHRGLQQSRVYADKDLVACVVKMGFKPSHSLLFVGFFLCINIQLFEYHCKDYFLQYNPGNA